MTYYRLKYATQESEVGSTFPQSHTSRSTVHVDDPRYIGKQDLGKLPSNVVFPEPVLHPDARLTDLISAISIGAQLLISPLLKSVLERYVASDDSEFFPVTIHFFNESLRYFALNPVRFNMDQLNYADSKVWLETVGNTKVRQVSLKSFKEFLVFKESLVLPERPFIESVSFTEESTRDFLQLRHVSGGVGYFVSQKLKDEIEKAGCTGIKFEEIK